MAKSLFGFVLIAIFATVRSDNLLGAEELLDAFKSSLQVDNLLTSADKLSNAIDKLIFEADRTYEENLLKTINNAVIGSTLNATVKPYEEVVKEAALLANNASKACITKAQTSIRQVVNSGGQQAYSCALNTRLDLYNFTTTVASLDIGESSSGAKQVYSAVSKCPNRYLLNVDSDLKSAKDCYTKAAEELRKYIQNTNSTFLQLQGELKAVQNKASNCLVDQSAVAVNGAKAAIEALITCGKNAGVQFLPSNVVAVITVGIEDIEDFISDLNSEILNAYTAVNINRAKFVTRRQNIPNAVENGFLYAKNLTDFVEAFLKGSQNALELQCVKYARNNYTSRRNTEVSYSLGCMFNADSSLNTSKLEAAESRLKTLLANASSKAAANCTSFPGLTQAFVEQCMADALSRLQQLAWDDYDLVVKFIDLADQADADNEKCLDLHLDHVSSGSEIILKNLQECLQKQGIEFLYE